MKLTVLAACASAAWAFADTAAFFSSQSLGAAGAAYITTAASVASAFEKLTADFCVHAPEEQMTVFRVARLRRDAPAGSTGASTFLPHVHYLAGAEVDWPISAECSVAYLDEPPANPAAVAANVIVVDVEDAQLHAVDEYLAWGRHVVVQGKPAFRTAGPHGESLRDLLGQALHLDFDAPAKRGADGAETVPALGEAAAGLGVAEAYIRAQEAGALVAALSDDAATAPGVAGVARNGTAGRSNLFANYQFFTPGVWLVLIVCFFLVYVSLTAIGWITSIELSYRSFEKQVEYEKKTE